MLIVALPVCGATTYQVGPKQALKRIGDVPWESLGPGDTVRIHWRAEPYKEKFALSRAGAKGKPITVTGVPGAKGQLPVIDGQDAVTRKEHRWWNQPRAVVKIGGANGEGNQSPAYIVLERLDIRNGRPPFAFTGRKGRVVHHKIAAALFIEAGEHIVVRNCILRDSGNGIFSSDRSKDVLIEGCHIHNNGMPGALEHNTYTSSQGIVYQFNHFGPLRKGCGGSNLKDRSSGTVIRYNWIEAGNRQLDLVNASRKAAIEDPAYRKTFVYGNVLIEHDNTGNNQMVHYGGDSKDRSSYRKGTLYFYHNTVISTRRTWTVLFRLSTDDESCDFRNNVVHMTAPQQRPAMLTRAGGALDMRNSWVPKGWKVSHEKTAGTVKDSGGNVLGTDPGLANVAKDDYRLKKGSPCIGVGAELHPACKDHPVLWEYVPHLGKRKRVQKATVDLGAYGFTPGN
jgi:hypothetical protein